MNRPAPGWTDFKTKQYSHQEKEFDLHRDKPARALIWQMRTGKSKSMIDLACYLFKRCEIDGVIVVAPNNVHLNWETRELPTHHWDSVRYASFVWDASKAVDVRYDQLFDRHCAEHRRLAWYMVNAEALSNEKGKKYLAKFLRTRWRVLLIVDEVHEFRWATSKRSAGLRAVARQDKVAFRRILSANPIDNSPLHAFAEFEVLERAALGFEKYADFEARYGVKEDIYIPGGYSKEGTKRAPRKMPAITGFKNQEELRRKIAKWSSLVLREDCDDLPELLRGQVPFELTATQKRLHNDLVRATLARLDTGELIPPAEGGVLRIRLQQIASGFVKDEDNNTIDVVSEAKNPRMLALINSLNEVSGKAIVWCQFREDVVRVHRRINALNMGDAVHYFGGTSKRERPIHEGRFRNDPKCRWLVGQYQAGGQGLDFSAASDIFWYSHTTDLLRRRQADERATKVGGRRIGVIDLVAVGSNDEKMLMDLDSKEVTADYLTGQGLRDYLKLIR